MLLEQVAARVIAKILVGVPVFLLQKVGSKFGFVASNPNDIGGCFHKHDGHLFQEGVVAISYPQNSPNIEIIPMISVDYN